MIEIHSHVLPVIDDGARTIEEALTMLAQYAEQGVTSVVCTPHLLPETFASAETLAAYLDKRDRILAQLAEAAEQNHLNVALLPGTEVTLSTAILPYLKEPAFVERMAINKGNYILVELPRTLTGGLRTLEGLLFEIQLAGLLPILAHPERTAHNEGVLPVLKSWVESGRVLMQANAGHLVDNPHLDAERQARYRKRQQIVCRMIEREMIHFIASDAHDPKQRPCQHLEAYQAIEGINGKAMSRKLFVDHPGQVVQNQTIAG